MISSTIVVKSLFKRSCYLRSKAYILFVESICMLSLSVFSIEFSRR